MPFLYGKQWSKEEILSRVGNIKQLGGVTRFRFEEGTAKDVSGVMFNTGSGLQFISLIDRCLDIPIASFNNVSLCWQSCTGIHRPEYYEPEGLGWLRTFFGGLLSTCGLTAAGAPSEDQWGVHGLHGRINCIPAEDVSITNRWIDDDFEMSVEGTMREAAVFGRFLELQRRITARLGGNEFIIDDRVTNRGYLPSPFMILYHFNIGFPVLSEESELIAAARLVTPRDEEAAKGKDDYATFSSPQHDFREQVFFLDLIEDDVGTVESAIVNSSFHNAQGIGVHLAWKKSQLPFFTEWKQVGEGTYTVGMEPANCYPLGRAKEKEQGRLRVLEPGEEHRVLLKVRVLENAAQIEKVREKVAHLKQQQE